MRLPHRPFRHRGILVAVWLALSVEFLAWRRPGFWRVPFRQYEAARALADQGRDPEAIAEMARAVDVEGTNAGYLTFKGYLESRAGRAADAHASFTRALAAGGDGVEIRLGLADASARLGRAAEARQLLAELASSPMTLEQRYRRQALYAVMGDFRSALDDEPLLATDLQDAARLREGLHWALGAQNWTRAMAVADRLLALTADDSLRRDAHESRALALSSLGRTSDALAEYALVASVENLPVRARLASQLERHDDAAELWGELRRLRPDDAAVAQSLAQSLGMVQRLQPAIAAYRAALELADDPVLRLELVALLNATKAHETAWQELNRLPPSADQQRLRLEARTAFWAGRLADAASRFARLKPLTPADTTTVADLALALTERNQGAAGERIYRRLIDEGATAQVRERYAWWLSVSKRYPEAWSTLRTVSPTELSVRGRGLRARVAFWAEDYAAAAPLLADWVRDYPTDVDVWRDLAETSRRIGDGPTELRALNAYVALQPRDVDAAARRANLLDRAGRTDAALEAYAAALAQAPDRAAMRRAYGHLLERSGRMSDAVREYGEAWRTEATAGATRSSSDLALVIGRLTRAIGSPGEALVWYARAGTSADATSSASELAIEIAQVELDAGRADLAHQRMEASLRAGHTDPASFAFAANAAAAVGDQARAAAHLESLSARRPLSVAELHWQAGLYRLTGNADRALVVYDRLRVLPGEEAEALNAIGDLHFERGHWEDADDAWTRSRAAGPLPSVTLKLARLRAARGQLQEAVIDYERYLQTDAPEGLRIELARVYLGADRYAEAERWAREATASSVERGLAANLVLATAMHLQGRVRESYALHDGTPRADEQTPELLELFGQLAAARNQHIRAVRLFDQALAQQPNRQGDLWMWSAQSAYKRGDYFRSTERLARSSSDGREPPFAPRVRAELDQAALPVISVPTRVFGDSNHINLAQAGVRARLLPERLFETFGEVTAGRLSQRDVGFDRTRALVGVSRAWVTPTVAIDGSVGAEHYGRGGTLTIGRAAFSKHFANNSSVGVVASRDSMWSGHDLRDPRQFNRVLDLARLGPGFRVHSLSAVADRRAGLLSQSLVDVGVQAFQDDNRHLYAYGHHQFILRDGQGVWTAIRPNVYWEHFARPSPLYFSPGQFVSVGSMWHEVRHRGAWRLESEVNPKLTLFDARAGVAVHGLFDATREIGPLAVGGGAFVLYDDRSNYWAWRLAAQVGVRIGR